MNIITNVKKNKKFIIFIISAMVIFLISSIVTYKCVIVNVMWRDKIIFDETSNIIDSVKIGNQTIDQNIEMISNELTGFELSFSDYDSNSDNIIHISLNRENSLLKEWFLKESEITKDIFTFQFDPLTVKSGEYLKINIKSTENTNLKINLTSQENKNYLPLSTVRVNNSELEGKSICFSLINGNCLSLRYFFALIVFLVLGCFISILILKVFNKKVECYFVVITLFVGIIYNLVLPTYTIPDEWSHFLTSYSQSSEILNIDAFDDQGNIIVYSDACDYFVRNQKPILSDYARNIEGLLGNEEILIEGNRSSRQPLNKYSLSYFPQTLGLMIGRILEFNSAQLSFTGRFFSLIFYLIVMYFSLKFAPKIIKNIIFVVGLLPMTIQQIVSYNYDSVLFAMCFFIICYLMYLWLDDNKKTISIKDYILISIPTMIIASIKIIYLPILGIGLLIPPKKFKHKYEKAFIVFILFLLSIFSFVLSKTLINNFYLMYQSINNSTHTDFYTVGWIIQNIMTELFIIIRTIQYHLQYYIESMISGPLGWIDIDSTATQCAGFSILIFLSTLSSKDESLKKYEKFTVFTMCSIVILLILIILQVTWTPLGCQTIEGVQGRYFLPMLPLLLVLVKSFNIKIDSSKKLSFCIIIGTFIMQICEIFTILNIVILR